MGRRTPRRAKLPPPVLGALLLIVLTLSALALRDGSLPERYPPLPHSSRAPLLSAGEPGTASLERLSRRYAGEELTLEVIYASPLLPADEAGNPVFRIVATFPSSAAPSPFPADLGRCAQLRTSDGQVSEGLLWEEEIRRPDRVLGYLCWLPGDRRLLVTSETRWLELSLIGVARRPLRFRWPVNEVPAGPRPRNLVE